MGDTDWPATGRNIRDGLIYPFILLRELLTALFKNKTTGER